MPPALPSHRLSAGDVTSRGSLSILPISKELDPTDGRALPDTQNLGPLPGSLPGCSRPVSPGRKVGEERGARVVRNLDH